jgi:hypothetical protein
MPKKLTSTKTTPKKTVKTKPASSPRKAKKLAEELKVTKDINIQTDKEIRSHVSKELDSPEKQAYLFPAQETELGSFQLDSLEQKKAKESKDLDFKEAWYCPSKELHDAFRFYSFQKNMKKTNVITKAVVELLEREGFLKKT